MNKFEKQVERAAQMPPEKLKEILLKIRKGSTAALTLPQLLHVVNLVGGIWHLELEFSPLHHVNTQTGEPDPIDHHIGRDCTVEQLKALHQKHLNLEVKFLPSQALPGDLVTMQVSPLETNAYDWACFEDLEFMAVQGIRITLPGGQSQITLPSGYDFSGRDIEDFTTDPTPKAYEHNIRYNIERWLKNNTDFIERVCKLLEMEEHVPASRRTRDNTGCCPVCFREMKLEPGTNLRIGYIGLVMVFHGFKRPHHGGYTEGTCNGYNSPPYELSSLGVERYLEDLKIEQVDTEAEIKKVQNDEPDEYHMRHRLIKRGEVFFEKARSFCLEDLQRHIKIIDKTIPLYETLRDEWKLRELPQEGGPPRRWLDEILRKAGSLLAKGHHVQ